MKWQCLSCDNLHTGENHSCEIALIHVQKELLWAMDKKIGILLVLDFSSAFDTVSYDILISFLESDLGISEIGLVWLVSSPTSGTNSSELHKRSVLRAMCHQVRSASVFVWSAAVLCIPNLWIASFIVTTWTITSLQMIHSSSSMSLLYSDQWMEQ